MKKFLACLLVLVLAISLVPQGLFAIDVHAATATSGTSGNCTWTLDGTALTISGNGVMSSYSSWIPAPWEKTITSVTINNGITSIGGNAFSGCSNLTSVTIPNSVTSIDNEAFSGCSSLTSIVIPDSVTSISSKAFRNCSGLTSLTIPDSITSIGEQAFAYCSGLTSIVIPDSVSYLGDLAFMGCSGLTSVTISNSVTYIRRSTFQYCSGLTSITIPGSVTSIDTNAFTGCLGLTTVIIPDSITLINDHVFYGCSNLTSVGYEGSEDDWDNIYFSSIGNDYLLNATWYYNFCGEGAHTYTDGCDLSCNTCQWPRTGEHTYDNSLDKDCNLCFHIRTFEEFPIVSISAEPKTVIEKTNGWLATDYNNGNQTYFQYYYDPNTYTLTMSDGLTFTGGNWEIDNLVGEYPYVHSDQSSAHPWGLGDHAVTLTLGAITGEYIITVIENPIQSITAEPITVVEGTHCYWTNHYVNNEAVEWLCYSFEQFDLSPSLTITMKDGSTVTGRPDAIYHQLGVYPSFTSDQSYENQWSVGTHTVSVSIGEVSGTFPYIITESPIESISAAPITLYENINGSTTHDWQTDTDYFQYNYYSMLNLTITYKDGTSSVITAGDCYNTLGIDLGISDDQSGTTPWGLGSHKATVRLGHLSCEVDITVEPDPVEDVELIKLPKTQYITGEYLDLTGAVLRVHFNDGTTEDIAIDCYEIESPYNQYYCNKLQAFGNLSVLVDCVYPGTVDTFDSLDDINLTYFGYSSNTFSISLTEKTIKSISLNDDSKNPVITVTYTDNTTQVMSILSMRPHAGDTDGNGNSSEFGILGTNKGHYTAGLQHYSDGSFAVYMGGVTSNKLERCDWYNIYSKYRAMQLPSFNGQITAENIDWILMDTIYIYGYRDGIGFNDEGYIDGKTLTDYMLKMYALDSLDLSLSTYYDSETDRYYSQGWGDAAGPETTSTLIYKNGYWEMSKSTLGIDTPKTSYARFDDDGRILRVSHGKPIITPGDLTDDLNIDTLDGLMLLRYLNGWDLEIEAPDAMDVNADGTVDTLDGLLLLRYLNGWDVTLAQ